MQEICEALDSSASSLMIFNSDLEELEMKAFHGFPAELSSLKIGMGKGFHGWVALSKNLCTSPMYPETTLFLSSHS